MVSSELARMAKVTSSQVRRDLMALDIKGNPARGYDTKDLLDSIGRFLDGKRPEKVVLVGVGNLGRAILGFFHGRRPNLNIVAAFDRDPSKTGRVIHGYRCLPMEKLPEVVAREGVRVGILTVPASEAQKVATAMVGAGVVGILNFAPRCLALPEHVFVEDIDMTTSLEKVAFFTRPQGPPEEGR